MTVTSLPMPIRSCVRKFVARRRVSALAMALGRAVAFAGAWVLVGGLLDRFLRMPGPVRLAMLLAGIAGMIAIIAPSVWSAFQLGRQWLAAAREIERCNPAFAQRLQTVVSQLMERSEYRGSEQMLQQLLGEVEQTAKQRQPRRWGRLRGLALIWGVATAVLLLFAALWNVPRLGLPTLVSRQLRPLAGIPPVTTTRITLLSPQNPKLTRGQALVIDARVERLSGGGVDIFTSHNGRSWTRMAMLPLSDTKYIYSAPAIDRDLFYYVRAGDAVSPTGRATVLRPPAVMEYRVRSDYPAYTRRGAITTTCTDGIIEALAGTRASIILIATEPLASATLTLGGQTILMGSTADASIWQAELTLLKSEHADLEMVSTGGLRTKLPGALQLRAQPDRSPIVRLVQPADDLRLHPRELLALRYQAMDDYGIAGLSLAVQVNSAEPAKMPIQSQGDSRRQEGQLNLDLAALDVKVGDVVALWLSAADGAGQKQASDRRHILVSPRSIDLSTYQRIGEFKQAQRLSAGIPQGLAEASASLDKAQRHGIPEMEHVAERLKASRALVAAEDDAQLVLQALLRVCPRSASAQQTLALAHEVDRATQLGRQIERLVAADAAEQKEQPLIEAARDAARTAQQLAEQVRILAEGEQAATILADLANLRTPPAAQPADRSSADRLRETQRRAQQDIAAAVEQLGLNPKAGDLDKQLQRKVDESARMMTSRRPIDFEPLAQQWTAAVRERKTRTPPLIERLLAAASVEALRPDTDPVVARDLQLAARAGEQLAARAYADAKAPPVLEALDQYPPALGAIQKEHQTARQPADAAEARAIRATAATARARLGRWAGQQDLAAAAAPAEPEDLAMQASADTAQRNYDSVMRIDLQLARRTGQSGEPAPAAESVHRTMSAVVAIDQASAQQEHIRRLIASSASPEQVAQQQRQVAEQIESIDPAQSIMDTSIDARARATAAMQLAQEKLAHLPQQMTGIMEAAAAYRLAAAQHEAAQREAEAAQDEDQVVARVLAEQARRAQEEAEERLDRLSGGLDEQLPAELAADLRPLQPETQEAVTTLTEHLKPALLALRQSLRGSDGGAVDRAAAQVRSALQRSQWLLSEAQFRVMERDPLVAAKWFAEAASEALSQRPADLPKAQGRQQSASQALNRAWVNTMRQAAGERLGLTTMYQPLLAPQPPEEANRAAQPLGELLPGVRQWGFFRPREPLTIAPQLHETDFGGYQEPLRLYFEAITKAQEQAKRK